MAKKAAAVTEDGVSVSVGASVTHPFPCPECNQSYQRLEHLSRHLKSHTGETDYKCDECEKEFARSDVLKRHKRVHEKHRMIAQLGDASMTARKKSALERSERACRLCAASKLKCSAGQPKCERCVTNNLECVYEPPARAAKRARLQSTSTSAAASTSQSGQNGAPLDLRVREGSQSGGREEILVSPLGSEGTKSPAPTASGVLFSPAATGTALPAATSTGKAGSDAEAPPIGGGSGWGPLQSILQGSQPSTSSVPVFASEAAFTGHQFGLQPFSSTWEDTLSTSIAPTPVAITSFAPPASFQLSDAGLGSLFTNPASDYLMHQQPDDNTTSMWWADLGFDTSALFSTSTDFTFATQQLQLPTPQPASTGALPGGLPTTTVGTAAAMSWDPMGSFAALPAPPDMLQSTSIGTGPDILLHAFPDMMAAPSLLPDAARESVGGAGLRASAMNGVSPSDGRASASPSSSRLSGLRSGPIMVSVDGLATRHQTPEPMVEDGGPATDGTSSTIPKKAAKNWINRWTPALGDSGVMWNGSFEQPLEGLNGDHLALVPKFDEVARLSLLETLRFSSLNDREYHGLYRTLSRMHLDTLDTFVQRYFSEFDPVYPFIHAPSFSPRTTVGFLLLNIIAVGCLYTKLPACGELAQILLEVSRRGVEHLTNRDNRLARQLPMIQAMCIWSTIKWCGSSRLLELSQVYRMSFVTCLRQLHAFDPSPAPSLPPTATLKARWNAWINIEERKRTALVAFALESEMATVLGLSPSVSTSELKSELPCSDQLWEAPSAEAWHSQYLASRLSKTPLINSLILDLQAGTFSKMSLSPFASTLLVKALNAMIAPIQELDACGLAPSAQLARQALHSSLTALGGGAHEFTTRYAAEAAEFTHSPSIVAYHYALLSTTINVGDLLDASGRASSDAIRAARTKIEQIFVGQPTTARKLALHAGQIIRVVRHFPRNHPSEAMHLFLATFVLFLFSRSEAGSASTGTECRLDYAHKTLPSGWIDHGGPSVLTRIGDLRQPSASKRLLSTMASTMAAQTWGIGASLAKVLLQNAESDSDDE